MKAFDQYLRLGKFDCWINRDGTYRVEALGGIGEGSGIVVWKGCFTRSEVESEYLVKLRSRKKKCHYSYSPNANSEAAFELTVPGHLIGTKAFKGVTSIETAKNLYEHFAQI